MANPQAVHLEQGSLHQHGDSDSMLSESALFHNPGISPEWTNEEQKIFEEARRNCTSKDRLAVYAKIATQLNNKTIRDVAFRCRWTAIKDKYEKAKRRKEDLMKRNKDRKERVIDPSANSAYLAMQHNIPHVAQRFPIDHEDDISYRAIDGPVGEILEHNERVIQLISANLDSLQLQDNIILFCQTRDNITKIINQWDEMPEKMKQMPPLPVKINDELADAILPPQNYHRQ